MRCYCQVLLLALLLAGSVGCARTLPPTFPADAKAAVSLRDMMDLRGAAAGPATASLGSPTGWGKLSGVFRVNGQVAGRAAKDVTKDQEICAPGGKSILDESVVVGEGSGLANVLIYVSTAIPKDDPQWEHDTYQQNKSAEILFDQKQCVFLTHVTAMRATQRLKVLNSDPVGHNTNLASNRGAKSDNFTVPANGFSYYDPGAASPAPFKVTCSIHPWMESWLMVTDNPYFAVTQANGQFEIAYVPAGVDLEFRVWQEKAGNLQEVTVNGQAQKWPKGKLTLKLDPDETRNLEVAVDSSLFR